MEKHSLRPTEKYFITQQVQIPGHAPGLESRRQQQNRAPVEKRYLLNQLSPSSNIFAECTLFLLLTRRPKINFSWCQSDYTKTIQTGSVPWIRILKTFSIRQ